MLFLKVLRVRLKQQHEFLLKFTGLKLQEKTTCTLPVFWVDYFYPISLSIYFFINQTSKIVCFAYKLTTYFHILIFSFPSSAKTTCLNDMSICWKRETAILFMLFLLKIQCGKHSFIKLHILQYEKGLLQSSSLSNNVTRIDAYL